MIKSKLTAKSQTTIPKPVRDALRLGVGDEIAYRIEDGRVVLTKAVAADSEDPFASFTEWDSAADHAAYGDL
jgi:antitoxin PrlF